MFLHHVRINCYHPQTKFVKVIFLHMSVILSMGGMCGRGACMVGGVHGGKGSMHGGGTCVVAGGCMWWQGGMHGGRGGAWWWGVCVEAGMCGGRGVCVVAGGACMVAEGGVHGGRGACMVAGGMCGIQRDMVNERAVRILLECILVL